MYQVFSIAVFQELHHTRMNIKQLMNIKITFSYILIVDMFNRDIDYF